jgi:DNA-binding MarR family transcriptional regulator
MSSSDRKAEIMQELITQVRHMSVHFVMFSQAVADRVGIHPTDNECLDFLLLNGPSTAGQLSTLTGLTTGAVTAVIDRLEKAGFVRREHDQQDRRRVIVVPNEEKIQAEIAPYTEPMGSALEALSAEFSDEQLEAILEFVTRANGFAARVIDQTRAAK